ncbi:hypothetical protein FF38_07961 [Lucilia cuprina]|uniref:SWIM-type domain-containing protein n=1 Tax=Lucilia cuprina TaxID=7375 RepID=A0A0L0C2V5_LUCCU|nr:hypothetical protein FF38_07961 [Lucilia cuprina]
MLPSDDDYDLGGGGSSPEGLELDTVDSPISRSPEMQSQSISNMFGAFQLSITPSRTNDVYEDHDIFRRDTNRSRGSLRTPTSVNSRSARNRSQVNYESNLDFDGEGDEERSFRQPPGTERCTGHIYDEYGFKKPHTRELFCSITDIALAETPFYERCTGFSEVWKHIAAMQTEKAANDDPYSINELERTVEIHRKQFKDDVYHIPLSDLGIFPDSEEQNDISQFSGAIESFVESLETVYNFVPVKTDRAQSSKYYMRYVCICQKNAYNANITESTESTKAGRSNVSPPLNCRGSLSFKLDIASSTLGIKHRHKPHKIKSDRENSDLDVDITACKTYFYELHSKHMFLNSPRPVIIRQAQRVFPELSNPAISRAYTEVETSFFMKNSCDWYSLMTLLEENAKKYTHFVFHNQGKTAIAIFFNDIMQQIPVIDALSFDGTFGTNRHGAELLIANACVDNTGLTFALMFVADTAKVNQEICDKKHPCAPEPDPAAPLKQCKTAELIYETTMKLYENDERPNGKPKPLPPKAFVTACFFQALKGVRAPAPSLNPDSQTVARQMEFFYITPSLEQWVDFKIVHPVTFPLLLIDKDFSSMNAAKHVLIDSDMLLCQWHVLETARRFCHQRNSFKSRITTEDAKDSIPTELEEIAPFLSKRAYEPHNANECVSFLGLDQLDYLEGLDKTKLCVSHNWDSYDGHIDGNNDEEIRHGNHKIQMKNAVFDMIKHHSRCSSTYPQRFTYLLNKRYHVARGYTQKELEYLCILEMVTLCVRNKRFALLLYLWERWYCNDYLRHWTSFGHAEYQRYTTNMISEGNNSKMKRQLDLRGGMGRVDRFFYLFDVFLYPDYATRTRDLVSAVDTRDFRFLYYKYHPSWLMTRWYKAHHMFLLVEKQFKDGVGSQEFLDDAKLFGTDAIRFQCSCNTYMFNNIHLCIHIVKAIDPSTMHNINQKFFKINLRARKSAPFYLLPGVTDDIITPPDAENEAREPIDHCNVWLNAKLRANYYEWRKCVGDGLLESMGLQVTPIRYWPTKDREMQIFARPRRDIVRRSRIRTIGFGLPHYKELLESLLTEVDIADQHAPLDSQHFNRVKKMSIEQAKYYINMAEAAVNKYDKDKDGMSFERISDTMNNLPSHVAIVSTYSPEELRAFIQRINPSLIESLCSKDMLDRASFHRKVVRLQMHIADNYVDSSRPVEEENQMQLDVNN